jgi:hypothetical protein
VFHVNDLFVDYANYAAAKLAEYADSKGYAHVKIGVVAGNYTEISTLETIGELYQSVHLKNFEIALFNYGLDGNNILANANSRARARTRLQKLADLSCSGLHLFATNPRSSFIPGEEYDEFIAQGRFYQSTTSWSPMPYYFPEGGQFDISHSSVYFISRGCI